MFLDATALGLCLVGRSPLKARLRPTVSLWLSPFSGASGICERPHRGADYLITVEAVQRLINPEAMNPWPALIAATLGLIVNMIAFRLLHDTSSNTNIRSAALHVLGDLLGSVAAIVAAVVVMTVGWLYADPMLTIAIVVILSRGV